MDDQSFASFEVCENCYELRGPFEYTWKDTHYTFVQECRCERDARPRDIRPPTWISFDFNTGVELCHGCGTEVLWSGTRWSLWFCKVCLARAFDCNREAGTTVVPIGRDSLMHGVGMSARSARSRRVVGAFMAGIESLVERMQLLHDWSHEVVRRNLVDARLGGQPTITLPHYLAAVTGLDPADRFATMLEWMRWHEPTSG
jgi:hypothetical protein